MDGGWGSFVVPAMVLYSCGINIFAGVVGAVYCTVQAGLANNKEERQNQKRNVQLWAVSAIPIVGPSIVVCYMI